LTLAIAIRPDKRRSGTATALAKPVAPQQQSGQAQSQDVMPASNRIRFPFRGAGPTAESDPATQFRAIEDKA
jgi:hypothetical protein